MFLQRKYQRRTAATAVEFAVVGSALFIIIFALAVGAMGVFRYQEVAHLAREGSRYAATHGGQYHREGIDIQTGVPQVITSADVASFLSTKTVALDTSLLTVAASWSAPAGYTPINWPVFDNTDPTLVPPGQKTIPNYVSVTVTYAWSPMWGLVGSYNLTSTSTVPMCY